MKGVGSSIIGFSSSFYHADKRRKLGKEISLDKHDQNFTRVIFGLFRFIVLLPLATGLSAEHQLLGGGPHESFDRKRHPDDPGDPGIR